MSIQWAPCITSCVLAFVGLGGELAHAQTTPLSFSVLASGQSGSVDLSASIERYSTVDIDLAGPTPPSVRTLVSETVVSTGDPFEVAPGEWRAVQEVLLGYQVTEEHVYGSIELAEIQADTMDHDLGAFTGFTVTNTSSAKVDEVNAFLFGTFTGGSSDLLPSVYVNGEALDSNSLLFFPDASGWMLSYVNVPAWAENPPAFTTLSVQLPTGMVMDRFSVALGSYTNVHPQTLTSYFEDTERRLLVVPAPSVIPEPGIAMLMLVGLSGLSLRRHIRTRGN